MKRILTACVVALMCLSAWAGPCTARDAWTGRDKALHFGVGAAVGGAGVLAFENPRNAFLAGVAVGALKEVYDSQHSDRHTCSLQDFAVTAAGAYAGAYGAAWIVGPNFIGYARRF